MNIIGLVFTFLLLGTTLGYISIYTKMNPFVKLILIIVFVWYSIVLFLIPQHFSGLPRKIPELPDGCWIISYKIVEPSQSDSGGMYFWIVENEVWTHTIKKSNPLNPMKAFQELNKLQPLSCSMDYDKELHKELAAASKEQKDKKGGMMIYHKKKGQAGERREGEQGQGQSQGQGQGTNNGQAERNRNRIEILNPVKLLPPK